MLYFFCLSFYGLNTFIYTKTKTTFKSLKKFTQHIENEVYLIKFKDSSLIDKSYQMIESIQIGDQTIYVSKDLIKNDNVEWTSIAGPSVVERISNLEIVMSHLENMSQSPDVDEVEWKRRTQDIINMLKSIR